MMLPCRPAGWCACLACRCRNVVLKDPKHNQYAWCEDFLFSGGATGSDGSCCKADGAVFYGWCQQVGMSGCGMSSRGSASCLPS